MSADTAKPDPNAPPHFICVECGHEKGCHKRKDKTMGRCWYRPTLAGKTDFASAPCTCKEFR